MMDQCFPHRLYTEEFNWLLLRILDVGTQVYYTTCVSPGSHFVLPQWGRTQVKSNSVENTTYDQDVDKGAGALV